MSIAEIAQPASANGNGNESAKENVGPSGNETKNGIHAEHIAMVRDTLIVAAVWFYFIGFVYIYFYFKPFDVSPFAMTNAPQTVLIYAYSVLAAYWQTLVGIVAVAAAVAWGYPLLAKSKDGSGLAVRVPKIPRTVLILLSVLAVALCFWAGFHAAKLAASNDVEKMQAGAQAGAFPRLHIIELQSGPLAHSTKEFDGEIAAINLAGKFGKATEIAQTDGQIYVLVANSPRLNTVYSIPKDGIMLRTQEPEMAQ